MLNRFIMNELLQKGAFSSHKNLPPKIKDSLLKLCKELDMKPEDYMFSLLGIKPTKHMSETAIFKSLSKKAINDDYVKEIQDKHRINSAKEDMLSQVYYAIIEYYRINPDRNVTLSNLKTLSINTILMDDEIFKHPKSQIIKLLEVILPKVNISKIAADKVIISSGTIYLSENTGITCDSDLHELFIRKHSDASSNTIESAINSIDIFLRSNKLNVIYNADILASRNLKNVILHAQCNGYSNGVELAAKYGVYLPNIAHTFDSSTNYCYYYTPDGTGIVIDQYASNNKYENTLVVYKSLFKAIYETGLKLKFTKIGKDTIALLNDLPITTLAGISPNTNANINYLDLRGFEVLE